jgi:hypothetical protein
MAPLASADVAPAVHLSLAAFPGLRPQEAMHRAADGSHEGWLSEPALGPLSLAHVQLVPQAAGMLDESTVGQLLESWPGVRFRLHANVRLHPGQPIIDLANFRHELPWFVRAAEISALLGAPAYSAHAGCRRDATLDELLDNCRRATDLFGVPVAIEGHYPTAGDKFLVSTWTEYATVLDARVPFVVDLSHLNIVAVQSQSVELGLTAELLASPYRVEVHVSDNDGTGDWHQVCHKRTWWHDLLPGIHPGAVVFSEGNHRLLRDRPGALARAGRRLGSAPHTFEAAAVAMQ